MKHTELESIIKKIIIEHFCLDSIEISDKLTLKEIDGSYDELDKIEIMMDLEDELEINIEENEEKYFKAETSIESIISFISKKIKIEEIIIEKFNRFNRFDIMIFD